jgi:hypothetical protein
MAWYVFALTDAIPDRTSGRGLNAPIAFRPAGGFFAAVERRADVPPLEFGALTKHQRIVERLAQRVPAILPVRFGTLLAQDDIDEALQDRESELSEAFDFVRGRLQMTWRLRTPRGTPRQIPQGRTRARASSGTEYLRNAMNATPLTPPAAFRRVRDGLGRLTVAERYQPRTASMPDALYHLIDRTHVDMYASVARRLQTSRAALTLSGPWAPYAFVPELF